MWRELFGSFVRGARFGLGVVVSTLGLVLFAAFAVVSAEPTTETAELIATPDRSHGERSEKRLRVEPDVDLLEALAQHNEPGPLRELTFALSREPSNAFLPDEEPDAPIRIAEPTPTPEPVLRAAEPAPVVTVPEGELYELLAASFPEEPDRAYRIVMCESSGNAATNTGNGYYGMWQFDLATWQSVGGSGLPSAASMNEQIMRARMLYELRGWAPWGGCAG